MRRYLAGFIVASLLPLMTIGQPRQAAALSPAVEVVDRNGDDVTVIAVVDSGITPYHWDFTAPKMKAPKLPLNRPPHTWLRGFPRPTSFSGYDKLDLTYDHRNSETPIQSLYQRDRGEWAKVRTSSSSAISYYWIPGTKIIGALDFGTDDIYGDASAHGTGASSVAVGNINGSCPECLLVFVDTGGFSLPETEHALEWVERQSWIDAVSNSYGHSTVFTDNVYEGSDTEAQLKATQRGQTVFFAAHNGHDRSFFAPNNTLLSSQPGPDWIVTVGAVDPAKRGSYTGHGKPADISGIGLEYPSAYGSRTVGGGGTFGGTSNATPVLAGMYGRALYQVRKVLPGPSRIQSAGVIARGPARIRCGKARAKCELRDGKLTAAELRTRFFQGATHTSAGMTAGTVGVGSTPPVGEDEFLNEGHGTYVGLMDGPRKLMEEIYRIVGPMFGTAKALRRPNGERQWMVVDSFCRQHLWGSWKGGYYIDGKTDLPADDPRWPVRTTIAKTCPHVPSFRPG